MWPLLLSKSVTMIATISHDPFMRCSGFRQVSIGNNRNSYRLYASLGGYSGQRANIG